MQQEPEILHRTDNGAGESLTEQAYRRLKREIIELRRLPGEQFTEQQVARPWGLSKSPVREALARLHRDGLVLPVPRAGYIVSAVTLGDAADLCDMRSLLQAEPAVMTATRGLPDATQERLTELCVDDKFGELGGPHLDQRLRENYEFEAIIANGCGNRRLSSSIVSVFDEIERIVRLALRISPGMPPGRIEERAAIVDAIAAGHSDLAREAMLRRTRSARREIIQALSLSADVTTTPISVPELT